MSMSTKCQKNEKKMTINVIQHDDRLWYLPLFYNTFSIASMSFQNLVRLSQIKKFPCLIMPMSTKCQKNEKKMTINVIQHDDGLWYLRLFYNGAFSARDCKLVQRGLGSWTILRILYDDLRQRIRAETEQISPDIIERSVQSVGEC
jgi:hypothetical protein